MSFRARTQSANPESMNTALQPHRKSRCSWVPGPALSAVPVARAAELAAAVQAGGRLLGSPGTVPELAAAALAAELPYLPGVATPSEVMAARALGICVVKLFPAEALGGTAFLRAVA